MNIELIKSELEKLTLMLSSWQSEEEVSAIERDIALDKLKHIYDMIRFGTEPTVTPNHETAENEKERDVEIELLFAEEEEIFTTIPEQIDEEQVSIQKDANGEQQTTTQSFAAEVLASAISISDLQPTIVTNPTPEAESDSESKTAVVDIAQETKNRVEITPEVEDEQQPIETIIEAAIESVVEPNVPIADEKSSSNDEQNNAEPINTNNNNATEAPTFNNNLFGLDEPKPRPRTKHQRMMSIYDDNVSQHEKVVDISKIFNMDIDAPKPMTSQIVEHDIESIDEVKPTPVSTYEEERSMTLADAIATPTQTLADTIVTPTALGDDMNHSKISSLRDGIGLNDKFLMIRDLFDGDNEAYDEAISTLDELESMDDCMIHIIENYAWNPDSEGSKFIMQLLERKLS